MVSALRVGPYEVALLPFHGGPTAEARAGAKVEALATLLNHAFAEYPDLPPWGAGWKEVKGALRESRAAEGPIAYAEPPSSDEEDRALRAAWLKSTGEDLAPGAVARVGMMGREDSLPVSWVALQQAVAELESLRASWQPEPGPALFVRPTRSPFVTPEDQQRVQQLEAEARAIDELDLNAEVGREPQPLIERRRAFLRACEEAALFAVDHPEARKNWLNVWSCERLLALRNAALELRGWESMQGHEELLDAPICIDYVRLQLWPPGEDGQHWARTALASVSASDPGEQGAIYKRVGSAGTRIWWRRDGSRPALLAVAQDERR